MKPIARHEFPGFGYRDARNHGPSAKRNQRKMRFHSRLASAQCTIRRIRVGQHFDPGEAVRIGPHRVVNAREINIELAAPFLQKVRQQKRHLVH